MPVNKPFLDSNVILALLSTDAAKADRAEEIVAAGGIISVQVLNEVVSVCRQTPDAVGRNRRPAGGRQISL